MSSNNSRPSQTARVISLIAGAKKYLANVPSMTFGGKAYTYAVLDQMLQSILTVYTDVDAARAALKAKLAVEASQATTKDVFMSAFQSFVLATFGNDAVVLAGFGITPRKARAPRTVEEKTQAVEKALATRAARHTMGKRQKADIKGVVPEPATSGTPPTPAVPPASPTPTGANAAKP